MKTWTAIGAIFSGIGVVVLIAGLANGLSAINTLNQTGLSQYVGSQIEGTLFWSAFEQFMIVSIIMFVIGGVAFYGGGSKRKINVNTTSVTNNVDTPSPAIANKVEMLPPTFEVTELNKAVSNKSKILCGPCGAINEIDAVYCKKCGKQFQ